jgi:hypothetical protein
VATSFHEKMPKFVNARRKARSHEVMRIAYCEKVSYAIEMIRDEKEVVDASENVKQYGVSDISLTFSRAELSFGGEV